mgnify:FL=1
MIKEAWFIVAIMSGVNEDGTKDVFIFQEPQEHGHFHSSTDCRDHVRNNPVPIMTALSNQYGNQPLEKILCVPEENVRKFLEGRALDAL